MRVLVLLVAALMLAGCAEGPDAVQSGPVAPIHDPDRVDENITIDIARVNGTAGGFSLDVRGEAGAWLVAYQPLPEPVSSIGFSASYAFSTENSGEAWGFLIKPSLTHSSGDGWTMPRLDPFAESIILHGDKGIDESRQWSQGSSSSSAFHGFLVAATADQPWHLTLDVVWDEDLDIGTPEFLRTGSGAVFGHGAQNLAGLPDGPAGQMRYEASTERPGWVHLEMLKTSVQPTGVRDVNMALPDGHGYQGLQTSYGYHVVLMGSASGNRVDYVGSVNSTAGEILGEATYAEVDLSLDFAHVTMPGNMALPGLLNGQYSGSTWPFQDLELPDQPMHVDDTWHQIW